MSSKDAGEAQIVDSLLIIQVDASPLSQHQLERELFGIVFGRAADKQIVVVSARKIVVSKTADHEVATIATIEPVVSLTADEQIGAAQTGDCVISAIALKVVVTLIAKDRIVGRTAVDILDSRYPGTDGCRGSGRQIDLNACRVCREIERIRVGAAIN